ncbi:hypothetical protein QBC38DRAFT_476371 [Podospora fimiseda]|uniref:Uncharacterized protein n=1 Tax=Podospora fimiseda TaxID=252190 RepID=A0AAN7GVR3_9PEZI|nr:hypothetical protein QBC38DRAFT_476371 [Podospora fimiseda]
MIDDALKPEVIKWSAFYEQRIKTGIKVIFYLRAFVAKFMTILERGYEIWRSEMEFMEFGSIYQILDILGIN